MEPLTKRQVNQAISVLKLFYVKNGKSFFKRLINTIMGFMNDILQFYPTKEKQYSIFYLDLNIIFKSAGENIWRKTFFNNLANTDYVLNPGKYYYVNPHAPDQFTLSRARCAKKCRLALTYR